MTFVKLGAVRAFPGAVPDKAQALKPLEEAAEVFGAWQVYDSDDMTHVGYNASVLLDEIADTVQACCNLASALGVTDLTPYLAACEERNRERGRYDSGDR